MTTGQMLLRMQELDLTIARKTRELEAFPELKELARKRASHKKLTGELAQILGTRKDLEIELQDLAQEQADLEDAVGNVQSFMAGVTEYRQVQDFQERLATIGKNLDKVAYARAGKRRELDAALEREQALRSYVERFESSIRADAQRAREVAEGVMAEIEQAKSERERLEHRLDRDALALYQTASTEFNGLGVERLSGSVPSVCRTSLTESSLFDLRHGDRVTRCPYCHRILVLEDDDE